MVKVIDKNGQELAPTLRYGKVRHMIKDKRCVVVSKNPFTIRLTYDTKPVKR